MLAVLLGGLGVGTGSAASPTPTFLAASNTEPAFDFLTQSFVNDANGGRSVTFSFGASGHLSQEADSGIDYASDGSGNAPAGVALFASADEANIDNTIPLGAAASVNKGAVARFRSGQCVDPHTPGLPLPAVDVSQGTSCPGIGSTRAQYTDGRLVIFSCRLGGRTLPPVPGAPGCAKPVSGYFSASGPDKAPSTMAEVWADLLAHTARAYGGTAASNVGGYLAIADPKNGWVFLSSGCGPSSVAADAPYGLAGMEALYTAAVGYYHAHPESALGSSAADQACAEIDLLTDRNADADTYVTPSPSANSLAGDGDYSDPSLPIIFGDNVSYTQDSVVGGTSQIGLLPKSFVVSPSGNDTDYWAEVPECGAVSLAKATVTNGWRADISSEQPCTDSDYVAAMHDGVAATISSGNFGSGGKASPKTLVGERGLYQPIRQWVVVENDDQGRDGAADLTTADGRAALAFIHYLLSAKGQAVLASFGYDPIS